VQFNQDNRELSLKVVYYGPALSGKTTNLRELHARLSPDVRGRLLTVDTKSDRTLFFDLLPVFFESSSGLRVKIKLYTVPGQVMHIATRRIVLQGADAIAFIADSQREQTRANNEYWRNMLDDLRLNGLAREGLPTVIQFNKQDLPNVRSKEEIAEVTKRGEEQVFLASALHGEGVVETLHGLLGVTHTMLEKRLRLGSRWRLSKDEFLGKIFSTFDLRGTKLSSQG
jgi:signal recognition particle receptor subunit beta